MDDENKKTELNFQNYSFKDILNLFKISNNICDDEIIEAKNSLIKIKNNKVDTSIKTLFQKCYSIVQCVQKYRDYIKLTSPEYIYTEKDDEEFIKAVKMVPEFDKYNNVLDIVHNIVKSSQYLNQNIKGGEYIQEGKKSILYKNPENIVYNVENHHPTNPNPLPPITNTYENRIAPGDINAIRRDTQLTNLHINSCFRENYYKSNPCDYRYCIPPINNLLSMKLASIELPNSWFLFSHIKKNNSFKIEITICDKCSVFTLIIPDGNYDTETFVNFINSRYLNSSDTETPLKFLKYSIHPLTNKSQFEIMESAPETFVFSLHFTDEGVDNILETTGWIMGFRLARYLKIDDTIFSEGLFDGGGDRYVFLAVNDYQYNYNETNIVCFDNMSINENIIAKIPLRNGKLSFTIDENDKNPLIKIRRYNGPVNINKIEIKLLDKFGDVIDLNHMDWSFSLELEILYENTLKT
jgi:hypothetical protein